MFARPSILPGILISSLEEWQHCSLFPEIVKKLSPCVRKLLLKIFLAKMKFSGKQVPIFRYFLQLKIFPSNICSLIYNCIL